MESRARMIVNLALQEIQDEQHYSENSPMGSGNDPVSIEESTSGTYVSNNLSLLFKSFSLLSVCLISCFFCERLNTKKAANPYLMNTN